MCNYLAHDICGQSNSRSAYPSAHSDLRVTLSLLTHSFLFNITHTISRLYIDYTLLYNNLIDSLLFVSYFNNRFPLERNECFSDPFLDMSYMYTMYT